jgi:hypothetical protein
MGGKLDICRWFYVFTTSSSLSSMVLFVVLFIDECRVDMTLTHEDKRQQQLISTFHVDSESWCFPLLIGIGVFLRVFVSCCWIDRCRIRGRTVRNGWGGLCLEFLGRNRERATIDDGIPVDSSWAFILTMLSWKFEAWVGAKTATHFMRLSGSKSVMPFLAPAAR